MSAYTLNKDPAHLKKLAVGQLDALADQLGLPRYSTLASADAGRESRDAAFEAVRKELCKLPRYMFIRGARMNIVRAESRSGDWIDFNAVHALFDPVVVDGAVARNGDTDGG